MKNAWICEKERTLIKSPVMEIVVRSCRSEEKQKSHDFYLMKSSDWSNIIPVTEDGKIVMVKQFRAGIADFTLEVPGGIIDSTDADNQAAAIREMTEETGYAPSPGARCMDLGWAFPNPAILNNRCHSFVIGPVHRQKEQNLDSGEMIEVVEIPLEEIPNEILGGRVTHALMLNTFFLLALRSKAGSDALIRELGRFVGGQDPIK